MIAQVDEQQSAMVADAVAPAGQPHLLADVAFAQNAAGVGAVAMHDDQRTLMLPRGKAHARPRLSRTGKPLWRWASYRLNQTARFASRRHVCDTKRARQ